MWFDVLSIKDQACLMEVVKNASKIVGFPQRLLGVVYTRAVRSKPVIIITDLSHMLYYQFQMTP